MCFPQSEGQVVGGASREGSSPPEGLEMVAVIELSKSGWVAVHEKVSPRFHGSAQPGRTLDTL